MSALILYLFVLVMDDITWDVPDEVRGVCYLRSILLFIFETRARINYKLEL